MSVKEIIPKKFLLDILSRGCMVLSDRQMGKSNISKLIIAEMVKQKLPVTFKLFDTSQNWIHNFLSSFKVQTINNETRKIYDGVDNILFDIEYDDSEQIMQFMGNTILLDYQMNRRRKMASNGKLNDWVLYMIEEAQNSISSHSLNRTSGRIWLKMISESANFRLAFLMIGQRPADISVRALERMQNYFIGRTTGDNNVRKLRGIVGRNAGKEKLKVPLYEKAKSLKLGEFIFYNGAEAWLFQSPKFEDLYPNQKPQIIIPPRKRWIRLW